MNSPPLSTAFFDIGNTLGSVRLSSRQPNRLKRLDVYPQVSVVLQEIRRRGVRLGIISNIGQQTEEPVRRALEEGHVYDFFEPILLIYGEKNSPEIFRHAAEQAGSAATPERCVYVGEDRDERSYALEAGFRVAPHPRLALEVLNGKHLRYVRVTVPAEYGSRGGWREAIRGLAVVPIHVTGETGTTVYAIATSGAASRLDDLGFEVLRLGSEDLPLATEVYFLRDDRQTRTGFLEEESSRFFDSDEDSRSIRQYPDVKKRSRVLAERIGGFATHVSPDLPTPQVYDSKGPEENGDPAERRSDHYSFQVVGYPACLASEELFPGVNIPGTSDSNPNYHRVTDADIDTEYAADIARAVAAAARATANI
jgi:hypothetical protein